MEMTMPFYTCIFKQGLLNQLQKEKIAAGITNIHCDLTAAPRHFVHVVFEHYAEGDGFSGGLPSQAALIRGSIRAGRTQEIKEQLLQRLTDLWLQESTETNKDNVLVTLTEVPGTNVMEGGILLPHPKDDAEWEAKHLAT
jgi:phenylpyruvate tautomerase PptA (4-oxalocrotonate tautomerase family)